MKALIFFIIKVPLILLALISFSVLAESETKKIANKVKVLKQYKRKNTYLFIYKSQNTLDEGDIIYLQQDDEDVAEIEVVKSKNKKIVGFMTKSLIEQDIDEEDDFVKKFATLKGIYYFERKAKRNQRLQIEKEKKEDYGFFFFGFGLSYDSHLYESTEQDAYNAYKTLGAKQIPVGLDFDFSFALSRRFGVGLSLFANLDQYKLTSTALDLETNNLYPGLHLTASYSLGENPVSGLYVKLGIGANGYIATSSSKAQGQSEVVNKTDLSIGYGAHLGLGYGFKFGSTMTIQLRAKYHYRQIKPKGGTSEKKLQLVSFGPKFYF